MKKSLSLLVLYYFRVLARLQLFKNRPLVIGVTGSAGKTTVMLAIGTILKQKFTVKLSEKANSQSGLSLNILGLQPRSFSFFDWLRLMILAPIKLLTNWKKFQVYVAEMGIDSPDSPANMEYLLKIVKPSVGVFTSVNLVHAQAFDHLVTERDVKKREQALLAVIAAEKAKLITRLSNTGSAIYNLDDQIIAAACKVTVAKQLTFGSTKLAAVRLIKSEWKNQSTFFTVRAGKSEVVIQLRHYLLPEHYGLSFAGALAVGIAMGISLKDSARAIETDFSLPPGRATLIPAKNRATILDSSYNSSPAPVLDFLDLLKQLRSQLSARSEFPGRILGLLGDMRELGKLSGYEHTRIAKYASEVLDAFYLVGPEMREHALPVLKKAKVPVFWFATASLAAEQLQKDLQPNDLLLVKGSQNTIFLETAVEKLMAKPEEAHKLLCRRGKFWDRQRRKLMVNR